MVKRVIFMVLAIVGFAMAEAQEFDKERFDNGLQQIANSNRNYFKNAGWIEESWYVLSNWYPDVLLIKTDEKYKIAKVINSDEVIKKFEALNKKKKDGNAPSLQDVENFNIMLWDKLEAEVKSIYGK